MSTHYRDYSDFLATLFPGKVQKLSVNAGLTCPNRDGTTGRGGCTYCNNSSFTPAYALGTADIAGQLEKGKAFFGRKYPEMKYLAYFQSYTSTHGEANRVMELFLKALSVRDVVGLVIGTRPDCMPAELIEMLSGLKKKCPVIIEYGAETTHEATLRAINRCHTWEQTIDAVRRTDAAGIPVGLHFILGLPGETREMMLETVDCINELPVSTVKFHQLQILRNTAMEKSYRTSPVRLFNLEEYVELCADIVGRLRRDIAIDRFVSQAPAATLVAPKWGIKNYQFVNLLNAELAKRLKEATHGRGGL